MCYGFVILSSAAGQNSETFDVGMSFKYNYHSTVLFNERASDSKNVGFNVSGEVTVRTVWGNAVEKLMKVEVSGRKYEIKT